MHKPTTYAAHITLLTLIALGFRLFMIAKTDILVLGWRPVELASIALNYYRNGMDFFFPQILWGGNGPGYVEMEFPLVPFLTAGLYRIFGVHDSLTLAIPLLSGLGIVFVTYALGRYLYGATVGLVAGIFVALSPTMVALTISLWPDPPMVFFGALGIFFLLRWSEEGNLRDFILGASAASLAILLKLTALYIGIPILFLCIHRYRGAWWRTPRVWLLGAAILIPPALWYWHAYTLYLTYQNTFGIIGAGYLKFASAEILTDPAFYGHVLYRLAMYHLGPLAFVALLYGLSLRQKKNAGYVLHVWCAAVLFYLLTAARGVLIGHYQYMLPIVPAAAPLAAFGAVSFFRRFAPRWRALPAMATLATVACLLYGATILWANMEFTSHGVYAKGTWENDRKTGLAARTRIPDGALIVVVDNQMDDFPPERSMTPPNVFYFCDKKGWYRSMAWLDAEKAEGLEKLRLRGARYLIVTANGLAAFNTTFKQLNSSIASRFPAIEDDGDGMIFDLAKTRQ